MTGVVKLLPIPTTAESAFIQRTVLVELVAAVVKVTGDAPHDVCEAIVNVSVTGHVGVKEDVPHVSQDPQQTTGSVVATDGTVSTLCVFPEISIVQEAVGSRVS